MMHISRAPSPNGTNKANLYVGTLGGPARAYAADSARRRQARDGTTSDVLTRLQEFLSQKLTDPADQRTAETLVAALLNAVPDEDDDAGADPDAADPDETAEDRRRRGVTGDRRGVSQLSRQFPNAKLPSRMP
jgi:hypothetical protein